MQRLLGALGVLLLVGVVTAFVLVDDHGQDASPSSQRGSGASAADAPMGDAVVIDDFAYQPPILRVAAGGEISVANEDTLGHTLTSSDEPKPFDTGALDAGEDGTITAPDEAGRYAYVCAFHPTMKGELVVE